MGSLLMAAGCSQEPSISFFCESDRAGNYILKWEVSPKDDDDEIKIYMSKDDAGFQEPPVLTTSVNDYVATIPTGDPIGRHFFRLKVNKTFSGVISNRVFKTDSVQNFRDLGGYNTVTGKQVKWGRLYRSGELYELTGKDKNMLDALGIKTVVDFRDHEERLQYPDDYQAQKIIHIPMYTGNRAYVREKIIDGTFYRGDAIIFTQDTYKTLITDYSEEFAQLFDILCDEANYPVLIHGYLGKDRVGLASYILLYVLGVSNAVNEDDYLLSNSNISEEQVMGEARFLPERMQEAATVVCKVNLSYLNYAKTCMINKSGSIDNYITNELKLTEDKKEKLRQILLY
ncbi:MAG TPA: hypothetical protein DIT04_06015 [Dysgonomonas sp.]|nr:hypothetical protein [Dysgonomonas sp.]